MEKFAALLELNAKLPSWVMGEAAQRGNADETCWCRTPLVPCELLSILTMQEQAENTLVPGRKTLSSVPAVPSAILTLCKLAKEKCSIIKSRKRKGGLEAESQQSNN